MERQEKQVWSAPHLFLSRWNPNIHLEPDFNWWDIGEVKKCSWCGKEYPDDIERCPIDAELLGGSPHPLREEPPASQSQVIQSQASYHNPIWRPHLIDFEQLGDAFDFLEGFSRPNWKVIRTTIERNVSPEEMPEAWTEAARQWAQQVGADLGGGYAVTWSSKFILVSALKLDEAERLLAFAEATLERICATLKEAAWRAGYGPHVIFLFAEDDDYYQYISYFDRDGIHPTSSGCLLHKDYVHIAMPWFDGRHVRRILTHELVHNSVVHLPLPLWLNEGLAVVLDRTAAEGQVPIIDHDLRDRHMAFWNAETVQSFWSGRSFHEPGDSNELSYSLASIIVTLLIQNADDFVPFVIAASWVDAGQTAALDHLGKDLGEIAGTFLGEGNWRPNRKAMVQHWAAAGREKEKAGNAESRESV